MTGSSRRHSAAVATTVASVGPYVLSSRRPGPAHRFTSSGEHASPPSTRSFTLGRFSLMSARNDGTVEKNVMLFLLMKSAASSGEREISLFGTTRVPPNARAAQISSIDASKATEKPWYTRSSAVSLYTDLSARTKLTALRCSITTPLGWPVDPEV